MEGNVSVCDFYYPTYAKCLSVMFSRAPRAGRLLFDTVTSLIIVDPVTSLIVVIIQFQACRNCQGVWCRLVAILLPHKCDACVIVVLLHWLKES